MITLEKYVIFQKRLKLILAELSKETGWHLFYSKDVALSEKPIEIKNTQGQLSNLNGYAIKWADGYELYRIDGKIRREQWTPTEPIEKITNIYIKRKKSRLRM